MARIPFQFRARGRVLDLGIRTRIMGIVNVTPDSFYPGGRYLDRAQAVQHCFRLIEEGADLLDIGGESSRPGARRVSTDEEQRRILPVIREVRARSSVLLSVDTYKSAVAEAALQEGADVVNDISAFRLDPQMPRVVAREEAGVILMHMRGEPRNMQRLPPSPDILADIRQGLQAALALAEERQIPHDRIILDPGIGFGKSAEDNLRILNRLSFLEDFHFPILIGTSRKSFLGKVLNVPEERRLMGTAASVAAAVLRGAHIVRVHDVEAIRMVTDVADAVLAESLLQ
ncbi:MAG: dihydropteroate synthase [Acidobacteriota bacterium]